MTMLPCKELHKKAVDADFCIERSTSFVSLLLPAMLFSRRKPNIASTEIDATTELHLPKLLNNVLFHVMRIEQRLIKFGGNFSHGGSRLIMASKKA
jgi:hypothetical protein